MIKGLTDKSYFITRHSKLHIEHEATSVGDCRAGQACHPQRKHEYKFIKSINSQVDVHSHTKVTLQPQCDLKTKTPCITLHYIQCHLTYTPYSN